MKKRFGKLVRDRVPDILRSKNIIVNARIMDRYEFKRELLYKLIDDSEDLRRAAYNEKAKKDMEEKLANLFECLDNIISEFNLSVKDIQDIKKMKKAQKGGYRKRIFLESVEYSFRQKHILDEVE